MKKILAVIAITLFILSCGQAPTDVEILKEESGKSKIIEIESDIVLVRVLEIDDSTTHVRCSMVNRLQEHEEWRE